MIHFFKLSQLGMLLCVLMTGSAFAQLQPRFHPSEMAPQQVLGSNQGCQSGGCQAGGCSSNSGGCHTSYFDPNCIDHFGRYVRVFGGWNWLDSTDIDLGAVPLSELDFNDGWGMGTAWGKYITPQVRRELEFTFRHNSAAELSDGILPPAAADGSLRSYAIMGNLVRELGRGNRWGLTPYIGGGLGISFIDGDISSGGDDFAIDDTTFAYQGFVGLDRQLGMRAKVFCEYRYFGTGSFDIQGPANVNSDRYSGHNVFWGLQFQR